MASFREVTVESEHGALVCDRCVVADNPYTRLVGLLGRSQLEIGEGLLMRPTNALHTSFLRFPIDAVFLDRDLAVVDVVANLRPWRAAVRRRANAVLELPAGEGARRDLEIGQRLRLVERWPARGVATANGNGLPLEEEPLRRVRVAVVSRDRRFLRVAGFLLARHGHVVEATRDADPVRRSVERGSADVVVVDATGSLTGAARTVRSLQALDPRLHVVVVADDASRHSAQTLRVLDKWQGFDDVIREIDRASLRLSEYV